MVRQKTIDEYARTLIRMAESGGKISGFLSDIYIVHDDKTKLRVMTRAVELEPNLMLSDGRGYKEYQASIKEGAQTHCHCEEGIPLIVFWLLCASVGLLIGWTDTFDSFMRFLIDTIKEVM